MRKSILLFTTCISLFGMTIISCKNSENNELETQSSAVEDSSKELEGTAIVPSGTYRGTAEVVDAAQKELYVQIKENTIIELYFSNETELTRNGEKVSFEALEKGQRLEVEVEKVNNQLNPKRVTILE